MNPFQTNVVREPHPVAVAPEGVYAEMAKPRFYRAPELHQIGTIKQMQGRNYNDNKDRGNDNYYV
jgi:hypothetical protein